LPNNGHGRKENNHELPKEPATNMFVSVSIMVAFHFLLSILNIIHFFWTPLGVIPVALGLASSLTADEAFKEHTQHNR
jgi:hypothetical protein